MPDQESPINRPSPLWKRALDLCLVLASAPLWLPLFLITALAVLLALGRPVFFKQTRPGLGGAPFTLVKFRTMRRETDARGNPLPDAQRMTRLGKLLRATGLDELPELFQVLAGRMSLVGPRPLLMEYLALYDENQARRHLVLPGITGLAQVKGGNRLGWEEKFVYDLEYVDNMSLGLDLKILALTLGRVFTGQGATTETGNTAEKFTGSNNSGNPKE